MTGAPASRMLDIYWDQVLVGHLIQQASGVLSFVYDEQFRQRAQSGISISLPLRDEIFEGPEVRAFFSGLLPEEGVRYRLARYLGVSERNSFVLLEAIGGECAGALALYPHGEKPQSAHLHENERLNAQQLVEVITLIKHRPFLVADDLRLSLAGAQDKLAVGLDQGQIVLMKGGQPTTHILKPLIGHVTDSVHNEFFCMKLAKAMGLDVPDVTIGFAGNNPYLLVERYDRIRQADGSVMRLHQEDFCQAMAILPELKYEREGGPGIAECQQVMRDHAARPAADQLKFLDRMIFNYLIGNADAHGKNFSLLYRSVKPELAPCYDLLSTEIYPDLSTKMAMKIGGKYDPDALMLRHWVQIVPATKAAQSGLLKRLHHMAQAAILHAETVSNTLAQEGVRSEVFGLIRKVIDVRAARLSGL